VFEHGVAYVCERSVGPARTCDFRSGKIILQQPIEREQMQKLLSTGRTDLITRFISKRGRPFKAFLVKTPAGKIGFEFMARPERKAGSGQQAPAQAAEPVALPDKPSQPAKPAARARAKPAAKPAAAKSAAKDEAKASTAPKAAAAKRKKKG
jgi:DNA topoisomerase-3